MNPTLFSGDRTSPENQPSKSRSPYRLYRFLTDLEDILATHSHPAMILDCVSPLVHRLLTESTWLQWYDLTPNPQTGWSVAMLYDEPDFPLTVQMVVWQPGTVSPIHNHGTWGVVAILSGQEKNTFWQPQQPDAPQIQPVGEKILEPGEILTFLPETIHHVEVVGNEPVLSFNVYGVTDYQNRFEFDCATGTKSRF